MRIHCTGRIFFANAKTFHNSFSYKCNLKNKKYGKGELAKNRHHD